MKLSRIEKYKDYRKQLKEIPTMQMFQEAFDFIDKLIGQNVCLNCIKTKDCESCNVYKQVKKIETLLYHFKQMQDYNHELENELFLERRDK